MKDAAQGLAIHFAISGFRQNAESWHGIAELVERLRQDGHALEACSRVVYQPWCADWSAIANHAWLLGDFYGVRPTVAIYGYSWGGGHGAMELARELGRRGIEVRAMVLADPVYRPRSALAWLYSWRALCNLAWPIVGEPLIRVPGNVREVWSFHQTQDRPSGHKMISDSRVNGPTIYPRELLRTTHAYIDNAPEFHAKALEIARLVRRETLKGDACR